MTAPGPYATQLGSIGAGIDSTISTLDAENANLTTELSAANAQIATLQTELAAAQTPPPSPAPTPPPTTGIVFVDNDFSGAGSLAQVVAPLSVDSAASIVPSPDGSGAKVVQFISPAGGADAYLYYRFANNAALTTRHPGGIFARFDFGYDPGAFAAIAASHGGQFKHWLSRYLDWNSTPGAVNTAAPGGLMGGFGPAFYGEGGAVPDQLVVIDDANTSTIPQSATGVILQPNVMQRVQYWLSRDPVAQMGHCKMWAWNGTGYDLKVDFSSPNMFRDTDGPYDHLYLMLGDSYSNVSGLAYLGRVKVADFFIAD